MDIGPVCGNNYIYKEGVVFQDVRFVHLFKICFINYFLLLLFIIHYLIFNCLQ